MNINANPVVLSIMNRNVINVQILLEISNITVNVKKVIKKQMKLSAKYNKNKLEYH